MKFKFVFLLFAFITQPLFAEMICEESVTDYLAVYDINIYTCPSGQFLPANTLGCRTCPSGYTCPGGTFTFNPNEHRGALINTITSVTMNNICADNFPTDLYAVYDANTITLNWDDGTNTTQNTCEYGGAVTLPPTPTRPGYVFNGWKVKTSNND